MTVDKQLAHPLADCDPADCYQTMMSERTALITARREAEDNLVKTVIQLAAALLALLAGFVSQSKLQLSFLDVTLFGVALVALAVSIVAGLWEQRFASQAYLEQQKLVEDYFQQNIAEFNEPAANKSVRKAQTIAFVSFVAALVCLGVFAFLQARESYVESKRGPTAVEGNAASVAPVPAPGQAKLSSAPPDPGRSTKERRDEVRGAVNAAAASENQKIAPEASVTK